MSKVLSPTLIFPSQAATLVQDKLLSAKFVLLLTCVIADVKSVPPKNQTD